MNNNIFSKTELLEHYFDNIHLNRKIMKKAAKMEDLYNLLELVDDINSTRILDWKKISSIRHTLGSLMERVNNISRIYKMGVRGSDIKEKALEYLPDIENLDDLREASIELVYALKNASIVENHDAEKVKIAAMQLINMAQNLSRIYMTPEQIQIFRNIASGTHISDLSYAEEVNSKRMESFLKGSIYSTEDKSDETKKVIREVLQNAVDATVKKQQSDENHNPEVKLYTTLYVDPNSDKTFMDLTVVDNGTGMDLETLAKNFYVYFQSGKEDEKDSAGGFGIAKAVIQETPKEGWSLETNDIGSSSFHKNMYMGTKLQDQFVHPELEVKRNGTQLNLYRIPTLYESIIKNICSRYATGEVDIYLNDKFIEPIFNFAGLNRVDSEGYGIIESVSTNEFEREVAQRVIDDKREQLTDDIGGFEWNFKNENGEDRFINVSFYLMKLDIGQYGAFYVRINGQYQYEDGYIPQCNIVCEIQTNVRPNEKSYPMDPGRENLRSPIKEKVNNVRMELRQLVEDITKNELFKEGLDVYVYNKDKNPINVGYENAFEKKEKRNDFLETMRRTGLASTRLFEQEEANAKDMSQALSEMASQESDMSQRQKEILKSVSESLIKEKDKLETMEFLDDIIDALETPCEVTVQKNFVTDAVAHDDIDLTSTMALVWQRVLKIIIRGSQGFFRGSNKEFIPGLIYSDKAIALYSPKNPRIGREYDTISINPMFIASLVKPDLFEDYLSGKEEEEFGQGRKSVKMEETPINRVSSFLFHEAIHEITHLLFPETYTGNFEEFHAWVSKLENANHFNFQEVRTEVKRYMPQLRQDADKLIRRIRKDHKQMAKQ